MKTRQGLVSNSSSSSFIVEFNKDPRDIESLKEMLGDVSHVPSVNDWMQQIYHVDDIVAYVHRDVMQYLGENGNRIPSPIEMDEYDEYDTRWKLSSFLKEYNDENIPEALLRKYYDRHRAMLEELYFEYHGITREEYNQRYADKYVVEFEFSDENGNNMEAFLRSANVFRNIESTTINNQ